MKKQMQKIKQAPKIRKIKKKPQQKSQKAQQIDLTLKSSKQDKDGSKDSITESKKLNGSKTQSNEIVPVEDKVRKTRSKSRKIEQQKKQKNQSVDKKIVEQKKQQKKIPIKKTKSRNVSKQQKPKIDSTDQIKDEIKQEKNQEKSLKKTKSNKLMQKYHTKSIIDELQNYSCQFSPLNEKYTIKMHGKYQIDKTHKLYDRIPTLFKLFLQKQKKKSQNMFVKTRYTFFPAFEFCLSDQHKGDHKCCICQFEFQEPGNVDEIQKLLLSINDQDIVALKCSHLLHLECLKMLIGEKEWFKCPVCSMIYGKMIGDQPQGTMTWSVNEWMKCDGYPDVGTIIIHYSMRGGRRGNIDYPSTGRTAYLPNNIEGNQVLNLLNQAFKRKLIFTIGRSVTTGRDNQIVWNGIHHKTNLSGGSAYFGYPDPTYFDRVKLELAAKGVF